MEEIIQILLTLGIILFAAISNIRKRVRQAEEEAQAGSEEGSIGEQLPEGWPMQRPELRPATAPVKPKRKPSHTTLHPDSQELLTSEIMALQRERAQKKAPHPTGPLHDHTAAPALKEEESAEKHPLTADFDARKAIIWSEIMKPKFDE